VQDLDRTPVAADARPAGNVTGHVVSGRDSNVSGRDGYIAGRDIKFSDLEGLLRMPLTAGQTEGFRRG
jgi:hypothetical protein